MLATHGGIGTSPSTVIARAPLHTNPSAATIGCKRGTGFQSTGAGRRGRRLPFQTCSIHGRRCTTSGLPCGVTSRTADSECADQMAPGSSLRRVGDPTRPKTWKRQSRDSEFLLREKLILTLSKLHGTRTFLVIVPHMVNAIAHWVAAHQASVVGRQQFGYGCHVLHPRIEP